MTTTTNTNCSGTGKVARFGIDSFGGKTYGECETCQNGVETVAGKFVAHQGGGEEF